MRRMSRVKSASVFFCKTGEYLSDFVTRLKLY